MATCCTTSIPEFPAVTVTQTVLELGSSTGVLKQETVDCTTNPSTLSALPISNASVMLFVNGLLQPQGVAYTISGQTITWTSLPVAGSTCRASYIAEE